MANGPVPTTLGGWPTHQMCRYRGCPIHAVSSHEWDSRESVNHESMAGMNWSSILSIAKQIGTGVLLIGVIAILIFGQ